MPSNKLFIKRALKALIKDEKTPSASRLKAIHLLGFLEGMFPAPPAPEKKEVVPTADTAVPVDTDLSSMVEELASDSAGK